MSGLPLPPHPLVLAARLRPLLVRLPQEPPAFVLATALNALMLPRLPADARQALSNRAVAIAVTDLGLCLRLCLGPHGFGVSPESAPASLHIAATTSVFWRLLAGKDDADRLFFERLLVMEGDTELGLILKNTLDALGPLWS